MLFFVSEIPAALLLHGAAGAGGAPMHASQHSIKYRRWRSPPTNPTPFPPPPQENVIGPLLSISVTSKPLLQRFPPPHPALSAKNIGEASHPGPAGARSLLRITMRPSTVSFQKSTNNLLLEITFSGIHLPAGQKASLYFSVFIQGISSEGVYMCISLLSASCVWVEAEDSEAAVF